MDENQAEISEGKNKSVDVLLADNLVKRYGDTTVVDRVTFEMKSGEIVGMLGKNGAGKTTTFYMIAGLVRPTSGRVVFKGIDVTKWPVYKRARLGLGYLAQERSIFTGLTTEENLLAILETLDISKAEMRSRCEELLVKFGLTHVAKRKAQTLSGGEQRKVEIARALIPNPSILMLDEPFAAVDPTTTSMIKDIIRGLQKDGYGILITDHNAKETMSVIQRGYILDEHKILCEGTSKELLKNPLAIEKYFGQVDEDEN